MMTREEFNKLDQGDIVRAVGKADSYVIVTSLTGMKIAVRSVCVTAPHEWELIAKAVLR
jgi:hypothetical protein